VRTARGDTGRARRRIARTHVPPGRRRSRCRRGPGSPGRSAAGASARTTGRCLWRSERAGSRWRRSVLRASARSRAVGVGSARSAAALRAGRCCTASGRGARRGMGERGRSPRMRGSARSSRRRRGRGHRRWRVGRSRGRARSARTRRRGAGSRCRNVRGLRGRCRLSARCTWCMVLVARACNARSTPRRPRTGRARAGRTSRSLCLAAWRTGCRRVGGCGRSG